MKEIKTLGENLKSARQKKQFTQEYVSRQLNISRQAISKWETGKGYPDLDNLVLLSNLYDVSLDELMNNKNKLQKSFRISNSSPCSEELLFAHIEELQLAVILSISCLFPPIGLLAPIGVLIWMKKKKKYYKTIVIFSVFLYVAKLLQLLFHIKYSLSFFQ
ncbi:helix-turn-helix domain-containing protein [[Clostridium] hylemonae]|uniref:DNA-binding helix-turn-helix protein n=1 Tax=[Clostridium] hylemonae DSM 15053 TaxID=553973 RepID=C0C135_9FIRM|nr:helix-turn-helix transcriptional regulator [[Clostridium] hylemonae]EEG73849.1 DNA-binding helix-turn-helix protein [[Clostridium] hylemonae DSM 15053]QEK19228.1 HTH-type transcriptional regulator ImmR [[Clostridium] hylemonae DSM 15053]